MLGGRGFLLACFVSAAAVLLFFGILHLPFIRVSSLLRIGHGAQEHSVVSAALFLWSNQAVLSCVLLLFAIALPVLKWLYLLALLTLSVLRRESAGSDAPLMRVLVWWPQDLIALAAVAALIAGHETVRLHTAAGAYCFGGAVIAMALAYTWRRRSAKPGTPAAAQSSPSVAPSVVPAPRRGPLFAALVGLALLAFGLGVTQPVVRLSSAGAAGAGQSIVDLVLALGARGEAALWVPIAILAILLPSLRQLYLVTVTAASALPSVIGAGTVRLAEALGRHATVDTMVLALGLFYLMETQVADRALLPGVYCLAASAALTLIAYIVASAPVSATTASSNALIPAPARG
jgi:hypothetical protein